MTDPLLSLAVGILPVLAFLAALLALESYKLVRLRTVVAAIAAGALAAALCWFVNGWLIEGFDATLATYSRYGAPVVEEIAKALVIVLLVRANRIGFLVDAAILGFAVGAGFAIVENLQYQRLVPDAGLATWIVRGFGTAIMHGGVTATFAMAGLAMLERTGRPLPVAFPRTGARCDPPRTRPVARCREPPALAYLESTSVRNGEAGRPSLL